MWKVIDGDCLDIMRGMDDASVDCCVTSPPYWGLRDYGHAGQIGLEATPDEYVARMVAVFREVRRVLRDDGTCFVNLGDSYASGGTGGASPASALTGGGKYRSGSKLEAGHQLSITRSAPPGLKPKDLVGIPWRVALALQADGWWLRQDIIWAKLNPMPESVRDRCTKAHEYVFLLTKSARYWWDAEAISEAAPGKTPGNKQPTKAGREYRQFGGEYHRTASNLHHIGAREQRNRRSVWTIATQPFKGSHFATMPQKLAELCIKAGCKPNGTVLDPFAGAGTTGLVADRLGRSFVGVELNPEYAEMARERIRSAMPLFTEEVDARIVNNLVGKQLDVFSCRDESPMD